MKFKNKLKEMMKARDMSRERLSLLTGISLKDIKAFEIGVKDIENGDAVKIAHALRSVKTK